MTPLRRAVLGWWPLWTALTITALVGIGSWLALSQPATDCSPAEILSGCGEAPPLGRLLLVLGIEAAITFMAALLLALLVRWFARVAIRLRPAPHRQAAPAARLTSLVRPTPVGGVAIGASALCPGPRDLRRWRWCRPGWPVRRRPIAANSG